ncbi:hypothetical protein X975_22211, partial [Stegodyphus mimosarum]
VFILPATVIKGILPLTCIIGSLWICNNYFPGCFFSAPQCYKSSVNKSTSGTL